MRCWLCVSRFDVSILLKVDLIATKICVKVDVFSI
uniref:Uncharacterized protein n=1 Tax=Podoviridae sp. ct9R41 TaxID=2825227 RepID=A0A8S5P8D3_9CAUD|nr:MAG TPA: hypothetical protein [Podoviridae sp. ct9R41]